MKIQNSGRIMVIGAHPDDAEMNAGGSITKWLREGAQVCIMTVASSVGSIRHAESANASAALGWTVNVALGAPDTAVAGSFAYTLSQMEAAIADFKPDTVITHFHADTHQDHVATYNLAVVAARKVPNFMMFKPTYPSGRPDIPFHPQVVSLLTPEDMARKVNAINCFESQKVKYGDDAWAQAMLAVSQGDAWTYAGVHGYAEVFQLGRVVI